MSSSATRSADWRFASTPPDTQSGLGWQTDATTQKVSPSLFELIQNLQP